jgi:hypothetical protein
MEKGDAFHNIDRHFVLLLIRSLAKRQYSSGWGYAPSGGVGLILSNVVVLPLSGRVEAAAC